MHSVYGRGPLIQRMCKEGGIAKTEGYMITNDTSSLAGNAMLKTRLQTRLSLTLLKIHSPG